MLELIRKIKNKLFTKEIILYLIFGVLTTLVNLVMFFGLVYIFHIEENISNIIAIVISILFAYFTNSYIVFNTNINSIKERGVEFFKFILGRAFTMLFEVVGFFFMFNILEINDLISKVTITIFVIILNYFISKYFSFEKS